MDKIKYNMITEDYVSFETAKLLKERGFEGKINAYYHIWDNGNRVCSVQEFSHSEAPHLYIPAPTLQMAMKWLREVHNIFIAINMIPDTIQKPYFFKPYVGRKIYNFPLDYSVEFYTTYEEASEAAIKYYLENLI